MAPVGYQLWLWFRSNPFAQGVAVVVALWIAFKIWLARKIRRERADATEEAREEVIEQIEEKTDEAVERVEQERRSTADLNESERLRLAGESRNNRGRVPHPDNP